MNQREKEEYLREYALLKSKGKPFFPYAVVKDSVMACIVMACIITMSLVLGAELGSKVNPTTSTYVPRPEWYFFFLFELLRVIKPPSLVGLATIGIPTLAMILLFLLPFYDRGPERRPERRPIATITALFVIGAMFYLTWQGACTGSPFSVEIATPAVVRHAGGQALAQFEDGQQRGGLQRLPGVPQARRQRQRRAGPRTDAHRLAHPALRDRAHAGQPDAADALVQAPAAEAVRSGRRVPLAVEVASGPMAQEAPRVGRALAPTKPGDTRPRWPFGIRVERVSPHRYPPTSPRPSRCRRCSTASRGCTTRSTA